MTRIAPLADVKARLSAYIEESQTEGPVVITRNGKAVAVLVSPVDDDDVEILILARSRGCKNFSRSHGQVSRQAEGSPQKNFGALYPSGAAATFDKRVAKTCRLFAVFKAQQSANRSNRLLVSATPQNR
jgi:prevent-host-death family protein